MGVCSVDGFSGTVDRKKLCSSHYERWERTADANVATPRPPHPEPRERTSHIGVRVTDEEKRLIRVMAEDRGTSISQYLRELAYQNALHRRISMTRTQWRDRCGDVDPLEMEEP